MLDVAHQALHKSKDIQTVIRTDGWIKRNNVRQWYPQQQNVLHSRPGGPLVYSWLVRLIGFVTTQSLYQCKLSRRRGREKIDKQRLWVPVLHLGDKESYLTSVRECRLHCSRDCGYRCCIWVTRSQSIRDICQRMPPALLPGAGYTKAAETKRPPVKTTNRQPVHHCLAHPIVGS
eukprot:1161220-Pelagomonas_calceolata.AAC.15